MFCFQIPSSTCLVVRAKAADGEVWFHKLLLDMNARLCATWAKALFKEASKSGKPCPIVVYCDTCDITEKLLHSLWLSSRACAFGPMRQRSLRTGLAWEYIARVVTALQQLHDAGLAHLDVRKENVCFDSDGNGKLMNPSACLNYSSQ